MVDWLMVRVDTVNCQKVQVNSISVLGEIEGACLN